MPLVKQTGKKVVETLTDPSGRVLYTAIHEVSSDNSLKTVSEEWKDQRLESENSQVASDHHLVRDGEIGDVVSAAKFAWDIIKDNKPVVIEDAKSCILSSADMDPLNYEGAIKKSSGEYIWELKDGLPYVFSYTIVKVRLTVDVMYNAIPRAGSKAPKGQYLPSIYVNVMECYTDRLIWNASGSVVLSYPANVGSGGYVIPRATLHIKLRAWNIIDRADISLAFDLGGDFGVSFPREE